MTAVVEQEVVLPDYTSGERMLVVVRSVWAIVPSVGPQG